MKNLKFIATIYAFLNNKKDKDLIWKNVGFQLKMRKTSFYWNSNTCIHFKQQKNKNAWNVFMVLLITMNNTFD